MSDNEVDDRLKAALVVLDQARGATPLGEGTLRGARKALIMFSLSLIAGVRTPET